jgi:hypothetical protein
VIPLPLEHRAGQTIVRTGAVENLYLYLSIDAFHLTQDLVLGGERCPLVFFGRDRHDISQGEGSAGASEGGLENVGVGEVAAFGAILPDGTNTEAPALSRIQ